ncbi:MAG: hypothetical protein ACRD2L_22710 [Terriglobia bacterium]
MPQLGLVIGWILTIFLGLLGAVILWKIIDGTIDLTYLISDELGYASLSRFQFLVFTFVIAMSLFYVIASQTPTPKYPDIPNQILALLGISGGSFVLSKGIQNSRDVSLTELGNPPTEVSEPPKREPKEEPKEPK